VWCKNVAGRFFGLVTKHACDGRTDRRTDGQNYDFQNRASIARAVKTVRSMLSDRCLSVLPVYVLSVTLVYCDQTVGWINMKLGMEVGLGPATLC